MRKTLYIIFIPLVIIEWIVDMIYKLFGVMRQSLETLALSLEKYILNEPTGNPPST